MALIRNLSHESCGADLVRLVQEGVASGLIARVRSMNLSESLLQTAASGAVNAANGGASAPANATRDANSFAKALAAAANESASARPAGRGTTPSIPVGKRPVFRGPHETKIPIAPDVPDSPLRRLFASAAAGSAALMQIPGVAQSAGKPGGAVDAASSIRSSAARSQDSVGEETSSSVNDAARGVATAYRSIEDAISGAAASIDPTAQISAPVPQSAAAQQMSTASQADTQNPRESETRSVARDAIGQVAETAGSRLLGTILENIPMVGNVIRLLQGSESHISPSAVAFAKSGPDAQAQDVEGATAGSDESHENPVQAAPSSGVRATESLTDARTKAPVILSPELLSGLPQIHASGSAGQVAPAAKSEPPQAMRDAQRSAEIVSGAGTNAAEPQATVSVARSSLADRLDAEMQGELAPAKSELSDADSPLGGQSSANQNADTTTKTAPVAATNVAKDSDGLAGVVASVESDANAIQTPRAIVESVATAAKVAAARDSGPAGDAAANTGGFAQAVTAAAATGPGSSTQQASLPSTAARESGAFAQAPPASAPQLPTAANSIPASTNSEMRVAMQTDLLGSIDLRAAMHQSTLTATIGVQREDVQTLLANELPALQHALSEKNLQVGQISVLNNNAGGHAGSGFDARSSGHDPRHERPGTQTAFTMPYVRAIGQALGGEASAMAADFYGGVTAGGVNVVV